MYKLLKNLTDIVGPSGFEQEVQRTILKEVKNYVDEFHVDAVGNLIVKKKSTKSNFPSLLIATHTDEVGFIVKKIENNGLIRFEKLGGFDDRILLAQPVMIQSDKGNVNGVIGTISAHYVKWDDPKRVANHREMYIDVGLRSEEEVIEMGIKIGQPISYGSELKKIGKNSVVGKALDDRAGCAVLIELLKTLKSTNKKHGDIIGVFTVQEEVGLRGASVLSTSMEPDYALAVDTTPTSDTKEVLMTGTRVIGNGPCIKISDKSLIASTLITSQLKKNAKDANIPHQIEVFMGIGTDAGAIHMTNKGVSSGVISIPSRYTHSPIELVDLDDLNNSLKLLKEFVFSLDALKGKTFLDT